MEIKAFIKNHKEAYTEAAPLAVFRILFGLLMAFSIARFWYHGWIEKLYILPNFHFKYSGFEFVQVPGQWTYLLFIVCFISSILIAIGYKYQYAIVAFFLSFTYIELMDKTTYLNHYYFISILSFILIWVRANAFYSIDAINRKELSSRYIPKWNIDAIKVLIGIVYIYAGLAKLNYDWLFNAMPLAIWLPTKFDIPILGDIIHQKWLHYSFSWIGAIYDITIVFFLMWRKTRVFAFLTVIIFHVLTGMLFQIGMFPYIMIACTTIFFSPDFHLKVVSFLKTIFKKPAIFTDNKNHISMSGNKVKYYLVFLFLTFQLLFPLRFLAYPGNIFWSEKGYRFSWRVMLMEKTGYANFKIVDGKTKKYFYVQNEDFLTAFQQKQMSTQADFIIEYGKYLGDHFASQGHENVEVYVDSYASLNGRPSQKYFKDVIDIMKLKNTFVDPSYIFPLHD